MCKTARRCPRVVFNLRAKRCFSTSVFSDWIFLLRYLWLDIVLNHIYWCKFRESSARRYWRCCWQWPDHSCLDLYHIYFNDSSITPPFHVNDLETRRPILASDLKWYQNLAASKQWTLDMTWGNLVSTRNAGEIVYVSLSHQSNAHVKVQVTVNHNQGHNRQSIYLLRDLLRELFLRSHWQTSQLNSICCAFVSHVFRAS